MNQTFIRAEELDSANSSFKLVWHAALKSEPLAQRRRLILQLRAATQADAMNKSNWSMTSGLALEAKLFTRSRERRGDHPPSASAKLVKNGLVGTPARSNPLEIFGFSANPVNPVPHGPGSRDYRRAFLCASFAVPN